MKKTIYNSELFWLTHPSPYVSMYMKYDWFQMDRISFMAYYFKEYFESELAGKKESIIDVLSVIWNDMPTSEKYIVLSKFSEGKHYANSFFQMEKLNEKLNCNFLDNAIKSVYHKVTGIKYDTNLLICYGINSAK